MMSSKAIAREWCKEDIASAKSFAEDFLQADVSKRFIFGRNVYASAIIDAVDIAGVIDDFSGDTEFKGRPILKTTALPEGALVVAASGGRPLTVKSHLDRIGVRNIDYFAFQKWSGLTLPEAVFNEGFREAFDQNASAIDTLFSNLADEDSNRILQKLFSFRYTNDLKHLEGFAERQTEQYFEPFFKLSCDKPVFVDVGGFDGFTSEEFIRLCPDYDSVFIFEPEPQNGARCKERLAAHHNINLLPYGAGEKPGVLRFSSDGSASAVRDDGEIKIDVRTIDAEVTLPPTFIKIDIEGSEQRALDGAVSHIKTYRPVLAVAVYHRPTDFWTIPEFVLNLVPDYKIYIRHYTESIYETVMYFVPPDFEVAK